MEKLLKTLSDLLLGLNLNMIVINAQLLTYKLIYWILLQQSPTWAICATLQLYIKITL